MASPPQLVSLSRRERSSNLEVGSFSKLRKHSEKSRWICIYPSYLNSKKSLAQGRKITVQQAVENPTISEIRDVLVNAGFRVELEVNKVHPSEPSKFEPHSRGRIRVQLKNDDGTPLKPNYPSSKNYPKLFIDYYLIYNVSLGHSILIYVAETIPKLKTRGSGAQASSGAGGGQGGDQGGSKKKKK